MFLLNIFMQNLVLVMTAVPLLVQFTVVPDVIDKTPAGVLEVSYPAGLKITEGVTVTPTQVKDQPTIKWNADAANLYTVVMVDPDAPSKKDPKFAEWQHWVVVNIPGSDLKKGEVLSEYIGAGPPKQTGLHRYIFLLYQQPGNVTFKENKLTNKSAKNRAHFKAREFATKYKLGEPIAANFFQAEYDDYVPTLMKKLKDK